MFNQKQAIRFNEILREHKLKEMSMSSMSLWFSNAGVWRDVTQLTRDEIFELFYKLEYDELFTKDAKSILNVRLITDSSNKKLTIVVAL